MGITGSIKKDMLLLMGPSWILIYFYYNYSNIFYDPYLAWFLLMFFQFFEILHELSTLPRVLNTKSSGFKQNLKYFMIGTIGIISFVGAIHYFGFLYFFLILVPLSIFHHIKQTTGILKWYFNINKRYCKGTIAFYLINYFFVCLLMLSEGTKNIPLGLSIDSQLSSYIVFCLVTVNLLRIIFEITLYFKHSRLEINRIMYLSHTMVGSAMLILLSKDYVWGYIFIIFDHCIQYLAISTKSRFTLDKHYKIHNYKQKIIMTIVLLSVMGLFINLYDIKINYIYDYANKVLNTNRGVPFSILSFKENFLLSCLIGISFIPSFLHYFYDLFIWKKSYEETKIVYSEEQ